LRVRRDNWIAVALALASTVPPLHALAQTPSSAGEVVEPTPEAREANARALELSRNRDFAGALALFQRAYDLSPSYLILYNIAKMSEATHDHARAVDAFESYLAEGGDRVEPERRAEVERSLETLRPKIGELRIDVDEPGADIEVDGRSRGRSPLRGTIRLNPGEHRVLVIGSRTESRRVKIDAGAVEALDVRLRPATPPPTRATSSGLPTGWLTAAWVATGVFAAGATITGTLALVTDADLDDDVYVGPSRRPPADSEIDAKSSRLQGLATATDVLVVVGALTGAAAITLTIVDAASADASSGSAETVAIRLAPLGVGVEGRF
jgi:hypothetical protein